jgi:hypothetical protein
MKYFSFLLAGAIGGAIGAGIWVLVGYFTGYEVGWIAWGVGILAGLGVRMAAKEQVGFPPAMAATSMAILAILIAKFAVVSLYIQKEVAQIGVYHPTPEQMIAATADEVATEHEAAGKPVAWPPENESDDAPISASYPPDIWAEGKKRWEALSPEQQAEKTQANEAQMAALVDQFVAEARKSAFRESFTPWDLLWFGLAAYTAFKIGSGADQQQSPPPKQEDETPESQNA